MPQLPFPFFEIFDYLRDNMDFQAPNSLSDDFEFRFSSSRTLRTSLETTRSAITQTMKKEGKPGVQNSQHTFTTILSS